MQLFHLSCEYAILRLTIFYDLSILLGMQIWNQSYDQLVVNVAADEALLDWAEQNDSGPFLRFWESPEYGVVIGYGNSADTEVKLETARDKGLPIIRRCSGGGTVLQGPGCFNYAFVLPMTLDPLLSSITGTTQWVMLRLQQAFQGMQDHGDFQISVDGKRLCGDIELSGDSDLTVDSLKFSGNAQRRRKRYVLFHGTVLRSIDMEMIETFLMHPSREPGYRNHRRHGEFIVNTHADRKVLEDTLLTFFKGHLCHHSPPYSMVRDYVGSRYS